MNDTDFVLIVFFNKLMFAILGDFLGFSMFFWLLILLCTENVSPFFGSVSICPGMVWMEYPQPTSLNFHPPGFRRKLAIKVLYPQDGRGGPRL